jgi:hypothetical protein
MIIMICHNVHTHPPLSRQGVLLRFILPWLGDRKSLLLSMFTDAVRGPLFTICDEGALLMTS